MTPDEAMERNRRTEEAYRALIVQLEGVFAASVKLSEEGDVREIHVLAGRARNPKQVMRDVQSALASMYHIEIDHRVISIAQLKEDPVPQATEACAARPPQDRLLFQSMNQGVRGDQFQVSVTLSLGENEFTGSAVCRSTPFQRSRAVAEAALSAVNHMLGKGDAFQLVAIQATPIFATRVLIVVLECVQDRATATLIGAAEWLEDEYAAIVRATLDALNRKLSVLIEP